MKVGSAALVVSLVAEFGAAARLGLQGKVAQRRAPSRIAHRDSIFGSSQLTDDSNVLYYANLTIGGQSFGLQIDTGSADLWVDSVIKQSNTLDAGPLSLTYAKGVAEGPIKTATVDFAGYTINNQAYLEAGSGEATGFGDGFEGIIGLGPSAGSSIFTNEKNSSAAAPPLDSIFRQNTSTPNFLSFLLQRSDDPDEKFPGDLTVGELLPGYENVQNMPKLTALVAPGDATQHWAILLDNGGIIGPDGNTIPITSNVSGVPSGQAVVILDTGFTFPQVPASVAQAIYGNISGASLQNVSGSEMWILPCDSAVNISFKFGGQTYPVHPLDAVFDGNSDVGIVTDECVGAFQPTSFSFDETPSFDIIFGMAFLRNVYALINFGDFVDGTTNTAAPFVQLLSITNDTSAALADFKAVRSAASSTRTKIFIAAGIAGALILLGLLFCCIRLCRRRRSVRAVAVGGVPAGPGAYFNPQAYRPLNDPAPQAPVDLHVLNQDNTAYQGYQPPSQGYSQGYQPQQSYGHSPNPSQSQQYLPPSDRPPAYS